MKDNMFDIFKTKYNEGDLRPLHDAIAAIIQMDDKYLMLDHVKFNFWTIPIGKVEPDQSVEGGLRQELKEEINITPIRFQELGKFTKKYNRAGVRVTVISHIFSVTKWGGRIKNNEPKKHRGIKWMTIDEIHSLKKARKLSDSTLEALKYM
jgi:ADP-ribose pyrophosphatase YjhB (NUDIX family)